MNIIVRKTDTHFTHPVEEVDNCLTFLFSNISPLTVLNDISNHLALIESISILIKLCNNAGISRDKLPSITDIYECQHFKGDGWQYYLVNSSENDGHETRHSVIIIDDDVKAVQLKLILS
jgi:hypothetical protein